MKHPMSRRQALQQIGAGTALLASAAAPGLAAAENPVAVAAPLKGRVKHSVCKWCYPKIPLADFCVAAKGMGITSVELMAPEDFPVLKAHGLDCAMVTFPTAPFGGTKVGTIAKSWNRPEHHEALMAIYTARLQATADAGFKNLICFSGNREGMSDAQGLENCAVGLAKLLPLAEKLNVTLTMELLNSKVNHKDYMCDRTAWGVALAQKLGSERFKLLYDIYHMQIMEGDVIATIKANHRWFSHYHTGGVPGRAEIDETQELYYPAIIQAIVDTGYQGYVGQEFIPKRPDALASLRQGVRICDV
jgi:hydroxypyruvate isomerase